MKTIELAGITIFIDNICAVENRHEPASIYKSLIYTVGGQTFKVTETRKEILGLIKKTSEGS
jgi:hypothetical protein